MGLPSKGTLFTTGAIALAMTVLTACQSIGFDNKSEKAANNNDKDTTEMSVPAQERNPFSTTIDEALEDARRTPIPEDGTGTKITPPFLPERSSEETKPQDTTSTQQSDTTATKSPFSTTIDRAFKESEKPRDEEKRMGTPPFLPDHNEPEGP